MNEQILKMLQKIQKQSKNLQKVLPNTQSAERMTSAFMEYFENVLSLHDSNNYSNQKKVGCEDLDSLIEKFDKFLTSSDRLQNYLETQMTRRSRSEDVSLCWGALRSFVNAVSKYQNRIMDYYIAAMMKDPLSRKCDISQFEDYVGRGISYLPEVGLEVGESGSEDNLGSVLLLDSDEQESEESEYDFSAMSRIPVSGTNHVDTTFNLDVSKIELKVDKSGSEDNLGSVLRLLDSDEQESEYDFSAMGRISVSDTNDADEIGSLDTVFNLDVSNGTTVTNTISEVEYDLNAMVMGSFGDPSDTDSLNTNAQKSNILKRIPIDFSHKYPNQVKRIPINFNNPISRNIAQGHQSGALQSRLRYRPPFQGKYSPLVSKAPRMNLQTYCSPLVSKAPRMNLQTYCSPLKRNR